MLKKLNKRYIGFGALAFVVGLLAVGNTAFAAADPSLTAAMASTTSFFTDNLTEIIVFVVNIILKIAIVSVAVGAVYFGYRKMRSIFRKV